MRRVRERRGRQWLVCLAIVVSGTLVRLSQLGHALAGNHAFRQTQTAFGIRGFAENGVNLLHSPLPIFGSATDVPMEFPLFQAFARQFMYFGFDDAVAGRVAGLVAFQVAAMLWWVILRRWRGSSLATTTLMMMEFLPFGLHWGAASLIDFFSLALGLTMVLGFDVWVRSRTVHRWFGVIGCVLGAWSLFLVKVTTVPVMGILMVLSLALATVDLGWRVVWARALWGLAAGPAVGLGALELWTRHADSIKERSPATDFLTSSSLRDWNFGRSRLDGHAWLSVVAGASGSISGPVMFTVLIGVVVGLLLGDNRTRLLAGGFMVSTLAPVLIFFNLFVVHSYYPIAVYPLLVALGALGVVILWEIAPRRSPLLVTPPLLLAVLWLTTTAMSPIGRNDINQFLHERSVPTQVTQVQQFTPPGSRIVTVGCDWDPQILFFTRRTGLMLREAGRAEVDAIWRENDIRDYAFLVTCDQSFDPSDYLPEGTTVQATAGPDVFAVQAPSS